MVFYNFNEFNKIFKGELKNQGIENMIFSSSNDVSFFINEKFKIKDFRFKSNIDLKSLTYINELKNSKMTNGQSVEENLISLVAKIGEKITQCCHWQSCSAETYSINSYGQLPYS